MSGQEAPVHKRPPDNIELSLCLFDRIVEGDIQEGNLPRDDRIQHQYKNAVRAMLKADIIPDREAESRTADPQAALSHFPIPINSSTEPLSTSQTVPGIRLSTSFGTDPFLPDLGP
jgi:hypothetical protein